MSALSHILEQINKKKAVAEAQVEPDPISTYAGRQANKRNAKIEVENLREEYERQFFTVLKPIVVSGEGAPEFARLALELTETPNMSALALAEDVAGRLPNENLGGRGTLDVVYNHLVDVGNYIGVLSFPVPGFENWMSAPVKDRAQRVSWINRVINTQIGAQMSALYLKKKAADLAFSQGFDRKVYPMVVVATDPKDADVILDALQEMGIESLTIATAGASPRNPLVSLPEINEESVLSALKKVKSKLKQKP
jgi:hypothetical protein